MCMCLDVKRHKSGRKEKCMSGINERMCDKRFLRRMDGWLGG